MAGASQSSTNLLRSAQLATSHCQSSTSALIPPSIHCSQHSFSLSSPSGEVRQPAVLFLAATAGCSLPAIVAIEPWSASHSSHLTSHTTRTLHSALLDAFYLVSPSSLLLDASLANSFDGSVLTAAHTTVASSNQHAPSLAPVTPSTSSLAVLDQQPTRNAHFISLHLSSQRPF